MVFEGLCGEISIFSGRQTTDRQTDKTDCLTPLRACARGVTRNRHVQCCCLTCVRISRCGFCVEGAKFNLCEQL